MYLIKRGSTYYFNCRIRTKNLRISLRLTKRADACSRAAHLFVFVSKCIKRGMNYEQIKLLAFKEAKRMHDEWLLDHFSGKPLSDNDADIESYLQSEKQELLHEGRVAVDQIQDTLAYIMYVGMREKTMNEWCRPTELLGSSLPISDAVSVKGSNAELLSSYVESFMASREDSGKKANDETIGKKRLAIEEFIEMLGNRPASDYDFKDAEEFRSTLRRLPSQRKTRKAYKGMNVEDLLSLKLERDECMSDSHIRRTLMEVKALFEWLKGRKVVTDNPFDTVSVIAEHESYVSFAKEDLSSLFKGPVFKGDSRDATRSRWWLMLLAAYTGARQAELCQLKLSDVVEIEGIACLSINDEDGKALKTQSAKRLIPLHPMLIELGFNDYVEERKASALEINSDNLQLLPSTWNGKGKAGKSASSWFSRYKGKCSITGSKKVFHSFRHTFIQQAISKDLELSKIQQMVGHESSLMGATKTYSGEGYPVALLLEGLKEIEFDGIDLDWLKDNHWSKLDKP